MGSVPATRLAATVIVAVGNSSSSRIPPIISGTHEVKDGHDFKILMVKRHSKARFMPNAHVFPGGKHAAPFLNLLSFRNLMRYRLIGVYETQDADPLYSERITSSPEDSKYEISSPTSNTVVPSTAVRVTGQWYRNSQLQKEFHA